jgi:subtilisin family serine protease
MVPRTLRRLAALVTAAAMLLPVASPALAADPTAGFTATPITGGETISVDVSKAFVRDGMTNVIVKLSNDSVAAYRGGIKGLPATNPAARGARSINLKAAETRNYRAYLKRKQDAFAVRLAKASPDAKVTRRYDLVLNGLAVRVPAGDVNAIAGLPGVAAVLPDELLTLQTDATPGFIGATSAWTGLGGQESAGQGVIVGVLDTGIWPEHPSFSDPDPSGKAYAAPPAAPDGSRACQFSGGANPGAPFACNNKLIGATRVMSTYDAVAGLVAGEFTTARDDDGHGTHTASTAAGNPGVSASIFGVARGVVSGIAPRAYVESFKVCGEAGCFSSDSAAAVQAAIGDGVNVINFSISGGANPFGDAVELAFRDAYDAGIFVAASAGNSGPTPETTDHRGPWVTTVAASTANRAFLNQVQLASSDGATLVLDGTSLTAGAGPAPVVVAANTICGPVAAGTYAGQIVVCRRGVLGRAEKGFNVASGGGVGMILYNNAPSVTDLETDNHYLPASHIQYAQGTALLEFLGAHPDVTATITAGAKGSQQGDVMASFSSRGGPAQTLGVSKPDITAPGVQILAGASPQHVGVAGGPQGELFQAIAGTSMSSPHIAGSGALIKALHPTWTPGQIKSALMTTARTAGLVKEDGSTPANAFDMGSGRVDLTTAGDPGLTFDATGAQLTAGAANLFTVNQPSVYVPALPGTVTVTRTARNTQATSVIWQLRTSAPSDLRITVPGKLTINPGASASFTIGIDATAVPIGETRFGTVTLVQTRGGSRTLHIPVTIVRRRAAIGFTTACAPTSLTVGALTHCTLTASNPTPADVSFSITDKLPAQLKLVAASVTGGTVTGKDTVVSSGTLPGSQPPDVAIAAAPGGSPAGYLPLSLFGIAPIAGVGDETITNFNVPAFTLAGETYTRIGLVSNGYAVLGGGNGADVDFVNQHLPNPIAPNNVLAPFWTDLNPGSGGAMRIGTLTDGVTTWLVLEWDAVREYSSAARTHSFQIWIQLGTTEDVTFTYGPNTGNGDGGFATVGVENRAGNRGQNVYVDGVGTLPANGTELRVTGTPGVASSLTVAFDARAGDTPAAWKNCASLTSSGFVGTSVSCVSGAIVP